MSSHKWFHPNINGVAAAKLLKDCGYDGAFLVRRSSGNPSDFTLCCSKDGEVYHIKIQSTGDFFDLYGGETFATLFELIEHYRDPSSPGLKEAKGKLLELKYPVLSTDPTTERWFHGQLGGKDSERLLKEKGADGSFLVRASQSQPGNFVLSIKETKDTVTHVHVRCKNNRFDVGGGDDFPDLTALVTHYQENPMVQKSGNVVSMKQPFNATRVSAASIQARVNELGKETDEVFGRGGFWEEFEDLQKDESLLLFPRKEGQRPENKSKNRYKNILPFDHTRVKLLNYKDGVIGADYINANYIDGTTPNTKRAYIACQGPLKATVTHFWQMMWEQNTSVIVMTTAIVERNKNKCHPYWCMEKGKAARFGDYVIDYGSEKEFHHYTLRQIYVTYLDEPKRLITQFHFKAWPDHGVPEEPSAVLGFLMDVNKHFADMTAADPKIGPLAVHCSAGIGRTGTFIVIDIILKFIDEKGIDAEIDIQSTIQKCRAQRSGMIQTEEQYRFCYQAIASYIDSTESRGKAISQFSKSEGKAQEELYGNLDTREFQGAIKAPSLPPKRR
eukprot:m.53851 g.53851  ORF g.53851 m.53851 type:complete len:558 (+) comp21829_c0_seq1:100-1773(+)